MFKKIKLNDATKKFLYAAMCFLLFSAVTAYQGEHKEESPSTYSFFRENYRGTYDLCDATEEYLYFATHDGYKSQVRVYDLQGNFLYGIRFSDSSNGGVRIRCQEGKLHVRLANDQVFIFRGEEMLAHMSREEAKVAGYPHDWFRDYESPLRVDTENLYMMDENGSQLWQTPYPEGVYVRTSPIDFGDETNRKITLVVVCVFAVIWITSIVIMTVRDKKERRH